MSLSTNVNHAKTLRDSPIVIEVASAVTLITAAPLVLSSATRKSLPFDATVAREAAGQYCGGCAASMVIGVASIGAPPGEIRTAYVALRITGHRIWQPCGRP